MAYPFQPKNGKPPTMFPTRNHRRIAADQSALLGVIGFRFGGSPVAVGPDPKKFLSGVTFIGLGGALLYRYVAVVLLPR
jgi:hypothetical protein